jgi:hypothetical protein
MTYVLNTEWSNYSMADRSCRAGGGFLVSYFTVREQVGCGSAAPAAALWQCHNASGLLQTMPANALAS